MTLTRKLLAATLSTALALGTFATPSYARYSVSYCKAYARDVANHKAPAAGVLVGTAAGAVGGLILGKIIGGKNSGAIGAIAGGTLGAAGSGIATSKKWHRTYDKAYAYCRSR